MKLKEFLVVTIGSGVVIYLLNLAGLAIVNVFAPELVGVKLALAHIIGNAIVFSLFATTTGAYK